jgi:hypothetical protein
MEKRTQEKGFNAEFAEKGAQRTQRRGTQEKSLRPIARKRRRRVSKFAGGWKKPQASKA